MRMLRLVLTVFSIGCLAHANDVYVDQGGDDGNSGTAESPVRTIARGIALAADGANSRVFINAGTYREGIGMGYRSTLSIIGVGNVVIENQATGASLFGSMVTLENLAFRGCSLAIAFYAGGPFFVRTCRVIECGTGITVTGSTGEFSIVECTICCNTSVGVRVGANRGVIDRCTFAGNETALITYNPNLTIRNCIFSQSRVAALVREPGYPPDVQPHLAHNDFFENTQDYVQLDPDETDLHVDPEYVNAEAHVYALRPTSRLVHAGRTIEGLPSTPGAHDIGIYFDATSAAPFSQWTDSAGTPVTQAGSQVTLGDDGMLSLNGVGTAAALSPVIDAGEPVGIARATFVAMQDLLQPSGSKRVVDADNTTFAREFEVRASSAPFGALDPTPGWVRTTASADINLSGRYLQMRMTLTRQGK